MSECAFALCVAVVSSFGYKTKTQERVQVCQQVVEWSQTIKKYNKKGVSVVVIRKESGRVFYPANGFAKKMRESFTAQGVDYRERGGAFHVPLEFCKAAWPADYADESNLKELIQLT